MIKLEHNETYGWEEAIRGMRNPMNSWNKSDSVNCNRTYCDSSCPFVEKCFDIRKDRFAVGDNDLALMKNLAKAGSDHRKFMRMIMVSVDITAPLYWWKEFDTYKVGTVANSCSTMHTIHKKEFTPKDFSIEHMSMNTANLFGMIIDELNYHRAQYVATKDKSHWDQMIQLLPSSYNQKRTVMLNYEVLRNMYHARKNHKLDEWHVFCDWIKSLPYSEIITGDEENGTE